MDLSSIRRYLYLLPVLFGLFLALVNMGSFSTETKLGADIVSRTLPALAPDAHIGIPYRNYWEITPPGHLLVLAIWMKLFGTSMISFKIMHFSILAVIAIFLGFIYRRIFQLPYYLVLLPITYLALFSGRLMTFIIPAEALALMFSIIGLFMLLYLRNPFKALFWGSLLFTFSGQVKDPFAFGIVACLPLWLSLIGKKQKRLWMGFLMLFLGGLTGLLINVVYLLMLGSWQDYQLVLDQKNTSFKIFEIDRIYEKVWPFFQRTKDIFIYWQYAMIFVPLTYTISMVMKKLYAHQLQVEKLSTEQQKIKFDFIFDRPLLEKMIIFGYIVGSLFGFAAQSNLGSHYYIQMVVPIFVFIGLCFQGSINSIKFFPKKRSRIVLLGVIIIFFLACLMPKKQYLTEYNLRHFNPIRMVNEMLHAERQQDLTLEKELQRVVSPTQCMVEVYGWGVGTTYFYAQRQPCTKFYLANIVVPSRHGELYRRQLIENPPQAIVYSTGGADMDTKNFEKLVFNYSLVLEKCYQQSANFKTLYTPVFSGEELVQCIETYSTPQ